MKNLLGLVAVVSVSGFIGSSAVPYGENPNPGYSPDGIAFAAPSLVGRWIGRGNSFPAVTVKDVLHGSPAARAGIMPGYDVVGINGKDVYSMTESEFIQARIAAQKSPVEYLMIDEDKANMGRPFRINLRQYTGS